MVTPHQWQLPKKKYTQTMLCTIPAAAGLFSSLQGGFGVSFADLHALIQGCRPAWCLQCWSYSLSGMWDGPPGARCPAPLILYLE